MGSLHCPDPARKLKGKKQVLYLPVWLVLRIPSLPAGRPPRTGREPRQDYLPG